MPQLGKYTKNDFLLIYIEGRITQKGMIEPILAILERSKAEKGIILEFNSDGGEIEGVPMLCSVLRDEKRPIMAIVNPTCCSSAYWIASACDRIYMTSKTARAGSIGVTTVIADETKKYENEGIKHIELATGHLKRAGSPLHTQSEAELHYLQNQIEQVNRLFCEDVAIGRKMQIDSVKQLATGEVYIGEKAVVCGLADGIINLNAVLKIVKENNMSLFESIVSGGNAEAEPMQPTEEIREVEILKKEIEMLKKENQMLKEKMNAQEAPVEEKKEEEKMQEAQEAPVEEKKEEEKKDMVAEALQAERKRVQELVSIRHLAEKEVDEAISSGISAERIALGILQGMKVEKIDRKERVEKTENSLVLSLQAENQPVSPSSGAEKIDENYVANLIARAGKSE